MPVDLSHLEADMTGWRRHIHQHPELGFHEHDTSAFILGLLRDFGIDEIAIGIGGTGIVATIRAGESDRAIGIRADIDALPMTEARASDHSSSNPGVMHACGHDGHTAMLLGAAKHLAATRNFDGAVHLIFQPAEESLGYSGANGHPEGGASAMIRDGLFERFPMQAIFGVHNRPGLPVGKLAGRVGPLYAAADLFKISVKGKGGHAARPHLAIDPILVASHIVVAVQSIVARNIDPMDAAVVSICKMEAGTAFNIIADEAHLAGTVRTLSRQSQDLVEQRLRDVVESVARSFGAEAELHYERGYPALHNPADIYGRVREIAIGLIGADRFIDLEAPAMGGEDFARYLDVVPGCFLLLGNGDTGPGAVMLHNNHYEYDDSISPTGAALWVALAENFLPSTPR
ncbi:M20 aminoacylase family protein [Sphingopyxis panaciterrae]